MHRHYVRAWCLLLLLPACLAEGEPPMGAHVVEDHWIFGVHWGPGVAPNLALFGRAPPESAYVYGTSSLAPNAWSFLDNRAVALPRIVNWDPADPWNRSEPARHYTPDTWDLHGRICGVESPIRAGPPQAGPPQAGPPDDLPFVCADPRTGARQELARTDGFAGLSASGRTFVWFDHTQTAFASWNEGPPVHLARDLHLIGDVVYEADHTAETGALRRWQDGTFTELSSHVLSFWPVHLDRDGWLLVRHGPTEASPETPQSSEYIDGPSGRRQAAGMDVDEAVVSDDGVWIAGGGKGKFEIINLADGQRFNFDTPTCERCRGAVLDRFAFAPLSSALWVQTDRLYVWRQSELVSTGVSVQFSRLGSQVSASGRWALVGPVPPETLPQALVATDDPGRRLWNLPLGDRHDIFYEAPDGALWLAAQIQETNRRDLLRIDPTTGSRRTVLERVVAAHPQGQRVLALAHAEGRPPIGDLVVVDVGPITDTVHLIASNVLAFDVAPACPSCELLAPGARVVFAVRARVESRHDGMWTAELP